MKEKFTNQCFSSTVIDGCLWSVSIKNQHPKRIHNFSWGLEDVPEYISCNILLPLRIQNINIKSLNFAFN